MKLIAKELYLKTFILVIFTTLVASAGVLENLDDELTSLVAKAEPYLVTVESQYSGSDKVLVGSGILIDNDGYILTTTSVIGAADKAKVAFKSGSDFAAVVVGRDFTTGLALLQIDPINKPLPILGDSYDIKEGSWIVVIGNSYEMSNAVNLGVYSGITDEGFLQLSVQTGPGSSGSAVFNTRGELIGVIVAQASETVTLNVPLGEERYINRASSGDKPGTTMTSVPIGVEMPTSGTSLAVPIGKLQGIINQIKAFGVVKHGLLGIRQQPLSTAAKKQYGVDSGVEITDVIDGSPAEKGGLLKGDIVIKVDDEPLKGTGHLYSIVRSHSPGDKVKFEVLHNGDRLTKLVVLGDAPNDGYFGFIHNSTQPDKRLYDQNLAEIRDKLTDKIAKASEDLVTIDKVELDKYLKAVDDRMAEMEGQIDQLTNKLNKLSQRFDKK
jgi:S1-C subfamily serine protease